MILFISFGVVALVVLIWLESRPKSRRLGRRSGAPKIWDNVPSTGSAPWFGADGSSDPGASHHGTHHDDGFHSSTNSPSDGGHFGGESGGHGGDSDGGGHH